MNEQWNNALDQVKDEYLQEAAQYRRKRYWPGVAAATAAVLVLAVGWYGLRPNPTAFPPSSSSADKGSNVVPPKQDGDAAPGSNRGESFWDSLLGGNDPTEAPIAGNSKEEPVFYEILHFSDYEELREACTDLRIRYLHGNVMIPLLESYLLSIEDICVVENEMYSKPWIWYYISHEPHITVRVPTNATLTAGIDSNASGAEALQQINPDAPNLHNREKFADQYREILQVQITTSEGVKSALLHQEAGRDRTYLSFLQNGTFVTVAGPEKELEGDWLETFALVPIT